MKPGQIIKKFKSKKGKFVTIRALKRSDTDDMLNVINSVIEEDLYLIFDNKKITKKFQKEWIHNKLKAIRLGEEIILVVEVDSHVVGSCSLKRGMGKESHLGWLGISIKNGFREEGIGYQITSEIIKLAKKLFKTKIICIDGGVYESNKRAIASYRKAGFKKYGKLPKGVKIKNKFISTINMYKELS